MERILVGARWVASAHFATTWESRYKYYVASSSLLLLLFFAILARLRILQWFNAAIRFERRDSSGTIKLRFLFRISYVVMIQNDDFDDVRLFGINFSQSSLAKPFQVYPYLSYL